MCQHRTSSPRGNELGLESIDLPPSACLLRFCKKKLFPYNLVLPQGRQSCVGLFEVLIAILCQGQGLHVPTGRVPAVQGRVTPSWGDMPGSSVGILWAETMACGGGLPLLPPFPSLGRCVAAGGAVRCHTEVSCGVVEVHSQA